jgi:hypothetical protein
MACLTGGRYVYRKDLGGLCNICNDYFYEVFDTLINLVKSNVEKESWVYNFDIFVLFKEFIVKIYVFSSEDLRPNL